MDEIEEILYRRETIAEQTYELMWDGDYVCKIHGAYSYLMQTNRTMTFYKELPQRLREAIGRNT